MTHSALAVDGQLNSIGIRNDVAVISRPAVTRVFSQLRLGFEIIGPAVVTVFELIRVVKQRVLSSVDVENRRRIIDGEQKRRAGGGVDDSMPRVQRRRKQASRLPLERLLFIRFIAGPDL